MQFNGAQGSISAMPPSDTDRERLQQGPPGLVGSHLTVQQQGGSLAVHQPVVIIGMGELGDTFARGFLRCGYPVYPILRGTDPAAVADLLPAPELVLVAVAEKDLDPVLAALPASWRSHLALLQNELLPRDWERHGIAEPTIAVVWFDKKKGRPFVALQPTVVFGPKAERIVRTLAAIELPCQPVAAGQGLYELVRKNLYILTVNLCGIVTGGTAGELWADHRQLALEAAQEILVIQQHLAAEALPRERLLASLAADIAADPQHICRGRSAAERLQRALRHAEAAGIATPRLRRIGGHADAAAETGSLRETAGTGNP